MIICVPDNYRDVAKTFIETKVTAMNPDSYREQGFNL